MAAAKLTRQASDPQSLRTLAHNIVLLTLSLTDYDSSNAQNSLNRNQDDLISGLQLSVSAPVQPSYEPEAARTEAQTNSLLGALLAQSGCTLNTLQHGFAAEYTANDNVNLLASLLQITTTRRFGDWDPMVVNRIQSKSLVFSGLVSSIHDLEVWTRDTMLCLGIGFPKGYLVSV